MNSRVNGSSGKAPKEGKNKDFLSIFLHMPDQSIQKTLIQSKDKVRISKHVIPFRKGYNSQFTSEVFEIVKIATYNFPTYNLKGEQGDEKVGKFYEQELAKCVI